MCEYDDISSNMIVQLASPPFPVVDPERRGCWTENSFLKNFLFFSERLCVAIESEQNGSVYGTGVLRAPETLVKNRLRIGFRNEQNVRYPQILTQS